MKNQKAKTGFAASAGYADELKRLIHKRTGIDPKELECPREKTFMTPCAARDGSLACSDNGRCIGCGVEVQELLNAERLKHNAEVRHGGTAASDLK